MADGDGSCQLYVKPHVLTDGGRHRFHVVYMLDPSADVVILRREEHLGFMLETPVGCTVEDPRKVSPKGCADIALLLVQRMLSGGGGFPLFRFRNRCHPGQTPLCIDHFLSPSFRKF
ncbi:hypothetical protein SDC9_199216 [bioreactor metagenome]|uniref:Uncharacterized protein n=1 Tax=bioreactor metagenome TaxID=1076179 RepID=A0A645IJV1_9ZZZZ